MSAAPVNALQSLAVFRDELASTTLGEIWEATYHPPRKPWEFAVLAIALLWAIPGAWGKLATWVKTRRESRRVEMFDWPVPKVCRRHFSPDNIRRQTAVGRGRLSQDPISSHMSAMPLYSQLGLQAGTSPATTLQLAPTSPLDSCCPPKL